jgi:hypothetical protein
VNLSEIIEYHFKKYPMMRPEDAVKLVYQNEFGGGHLIKDKNSALSYLIRELESTPANPSIPLSVPIGNGIVRVNLAALTEHRITPEHLNNIFVSSAEKIKGSIASFQKKLEILLSVTEKSKSSPFSLEELRGYITKYAGFGYPMVSHSNEYRAEYAPAYRVVLETELNKII